MPLLSSISPWLFLLALLTIVINLSSYNIKPITPAVLLYSFQNSPLPILLSPFLVQSWQAGISRTLQLTWIFTQLPSARLTLVYFAQLYPAVLAARAGTGFIFGRAVGWKYPHLFSHDAVYEPIAGFGPILLGSLLFDDVLGHDKRSMLFRAMLTLVFVVLDGMPWGYMCGAALVGLHRLSYAILYDGGYLALPRHTHLPNTSLERPRTPSHNHPSLSPKRIFLTSISSILVLGLTGSLPQLLTDLTRSPPHPHQVHIIMLTVPRTKDLASDVMIDSIQSYLTPWPRTTSTNTNTSLPSSLTVFAHLGPDSTHPAFDRARAFFHTNADLQSHTRALEVKFHVEPPSPSPTGGEVVMNHYAHLADAVRYARKEGKGAEWTMFVEDDFVLCGEWGWEGLMRVLERLDEDGQKMNGAFVGTGGSGILFHHTLLPSLEQTLSILSSLSSSSSPSSSSTKTPSAQKLIPPDVLLQNCLTGTLPPGLCSSNPSSSSSSSSPSTNANEKSYVIPSRMLMGHMGGKLSTGGRVYEEGKWACGWRSPMHGNEGAEVVVV